MPPWTEASLQYRSHQRDVGFLWKNANFMSQPNSALFYAKVLPLQTLTGEYVFYGPYFITIRKFAL